MAVGREKFYENGLLTVGRRLYKTALETGSYGRAERALEIAMSLVYGVSDSLNQDRALERYQAWKRKRSEADR